MRPTLRSEALALALVAASWLVAAWAWPHLPAVIPTHWGLDGQPNRWSPKGVGLVLGPGLATATYLLLLAVPAIDPKGRIREETGTTLAVVRAAVAAFLLGVTILVVQGAFHAGQPLRGTFLPVAIGLLFAVLGNYLPKVRPNYFIGVRTPWTLTSDDVWYRTHRVFGRWCVSLGLLTVVLPLAAAAAGHPLSLRVGTYLVLAVVFLLTVGAVGYSWWAFAQEQRAAS